MTTSREPLAIFEIDLPRCSLVFGSAPCTAALSASVPHKCFNTRATCEDPTNYDGSDTLTLRFAKNQSGIPRGQTIFPALQSWTTSPAEINLSGIDPKSSPLGKRARKTVKFQDFTYHDGLTDPYRDERISGAAQFSAVGYDPATTGSFFGKLLAREPYYVGYNTRLRQGYVSDAIASMPASHHVITEIDGPNADGSVTFTTKDVLDLAENVKAVAPAVSHGVLDAAISAVATTATLAPTGIGSEYAASGRVCIGREIMTFTRAGDVLTFTARGLDGTTAATHAARDLVQQCLRVEAARMSDTIADLLLTYTTTDPAWITLADWQAEEDAWLSGMTITATIPKPTGVSTLIGEIMQLGVMVWEEESGPEIKFRCNRPLAPGETILPLTDASNIIAGSMGLKRAEEQRISELFLYHGMRDATGSVTDPGNYDKVSVAAVSENLYEQDAFKQMFTRWFGAAGDEASAGVIADRLLGRYSTTPKHFSGTLDAKDQLSIGDLVSVQTYINQSPTGQTDAHQMQVNMVDFADDRVKFRAESYAVQGRFGFWMQNPLPDYSTATADEIATGAFWMDDTVGVFPDGTGPFVWF